MKITLLTNTVACGALLLGSACSDVETDHEPTETATAATEAPRASGDSDDARRAVATIAGKSGSELTGEAFFVVKDDDTVNFGIYLEGVPPGTHGVHIHENGDCGTPDASSAGGHWNPTEQAHGKWGDTAFHLGDIGNVEVGEDGDGSFSMTTELWSLEHGDHSVIGKAVIVHSGPDDFTTQPDGAAGERIGCGVIEWKSEASTTRLDQRPTERDQRR